MGISFHGCEFLLPIFQETYGTDATADEIMGDFGGVLKNQSIGVASADGKAYIHTAGKVHDASQLWGNLPRQDDFLEGGIDHLLDVLGDVIIGK